MLEVIRQRRSVRSYVKRNVESGKLEEILKAAMFSPSARNLRPWEFVVVTDAEAKAQISRATPYASFAREAPVVVVVCYDAEKGKRFREDCSICAANILLEASNQGLGACFVQIADGTEGEAGNPEEFVKKVLSIPGNFRVQCLLPLGYPEKQPAPHKDEEYEKDKVHYERF
ncbi:MAG: nitroreductase family protein [Nitrospirae bacterium]|nr:nitroreductase family protein [Nitrospirota bacterium]